MEHLDLLTAFVGAIGGQTTRTARAAGPAIRTARDRRVNQRRQVRHLSLHLGQTIPRIEKNMMNIYIRFHGGNLSYLKLKNAYKISDRFHGGNFMISREYIYYSMLDYHSMQGSSRNCYFRKIQQIYMADFSVEISWFQGNTFIIQCLTPNQSRWYLSNKSIFQKIFKREMFFRTLSTTLLQIFCKFMPKSKVIIKGPMPVAVKTAWLFWCSLSYKSIFQKIFKGEMFFRALSKTLFQIFCKFMSKSKVIIKGLTGPDDTCLQWKG